MRIGIVTFQRSDNYGAMFQAYALSKYLKQKGNDVFILDYVPIKKISPFTTKLYNLVFVYKFSLVHHYKKKFVLPISQKREKLFVEKFNSFRKKYLNLTPEKYNDEQLYINSPMADAYITGSDQVWNINMTSCAMGYLLSFLPKGMKRISYAASFSSTMLDKRYHKIFKNELKKFTSVSVREQSGIDIVREVADIESSFVVDPTLLLKDYSDIMDYSLVPKEPYVFVYRLSQNKKLTVWMSRIIEKIAKRKKLPVYTVSTNGYHIKDEYGNQITPSPEQFLGLLDKSSLFITNSFHGTVLAIILRKPFIVTARDKYLNRQNIRLVELLKNLQLSDYYLAPFSSYDHINDITDSGINYDNASTRIDCLKKSSEIFLESALLKC